MAESRTRLMGDDAPSTVSKATNRSHQNHESTCQVLDGSQLSESFPMTMGVRQGCLLSPSLFNLLLEEIMSETLENAEEGAVIGGRKIARLQFTDEIALLGNTKEEVQDLFTRLDRTSKRFGMIISAEKTKSMQFDRTTDQVEMKVEVNGADVEQVKHFKYLGSLFTNDGRLQKEIETRTTIATSALARTKNIWKDHNITIRSKYRLLRALVISCFLYGCETWTLTQGLEKHITAFEHHCYSRLLKIPYTAHKTNAAVLEEIQSHIGNFD